MSGVIGPEPPLVLAMDIGTSSVRAALFDGSAEEVAGTASRVERSFRTTPAGGAELDAEEAVEQVAGVLDLALENCARLSLSPEMVAVACFWHSLVGLDEEGRAVTPLYGWSDARAGEAAKKLRARFDESAWHARTGCRFHATYWPARFCWLREERSALFESAKRWMTFAEFLVQRFYGQTAASVSMASGTGLLNLRARAWDAQMAQALGISLDQLPRIAAAGEVFTKLREEYARRWPNLRDARWYPAIGDGAANNIGEGCVGAERAALMIGTSAAMRVMWKGEPLAQVPAALWSYRADDRRVVAGGALSDGGGLYRWMEEAFVLGEKREERERELAAMDADAHGLTVLPFWAGERSTGWSNNARGAILGLTMHTRPAEIMRAAMEAVAYRLSFISDALAGLLAGEEFEIVASGGALLASPAWAQIVADVLGRTLALSGVREASSRGAALLALEQAGKIADIETTRARAPVPRKLYQPDMRRHERYRTGRERQRKMYELLVTTESVQ